MWARERLGSRSEEKEGSILIKRYCAGCVDRRTNESTRVSAPPWSERRPQVWRGERGARLDWDWGCVGVGCIDGGRGARGLTAIAALASCVAPLAAIDERQALDLPTTASVSSRPREPTLLQFAFASCPVTVDPGPVAGWLAGCPPVQLCCIWINSLLCFCLCLVIMDQPQTLPAQAPRYVPTR